MCLWITNTKRVLGSLQYAAHNIGCWLHVMDTLTCLILGKHKKKSLFLCRSKFSNDQKLQGLSMSSYIIDLCPTLTMAAARRCSTRPVLLVPIRPTRSTRLTRSTRPSRPIWPVRPIRPDATAYRQQSGWWRSTGISRTHPRGHQQ